MPTVPQARDCYVVDTEPLANLVSAFVRDWNRVRPPTGTGGGARPNRGELNPVGAVSWLSTETHALGAGVPPRTIQKILKPGRSRHTELRIADALLSALDRPEAFHDGTFPSGPDGEVVKPNPRANKQCCGGSLNGSAHHRD